jgi:hypothetical protein
MIQSNTFNWLLAANFTFSSVTIQHKRYCSPEIHDKKLINKVLEERSLRAEKRVDELKDENLALKRERYAIQTECVDFLFIEVISPL